MPTFNQDILTQTLQNTDFWREILTNEYSQLVLMNIEPGSDIGEEMHASDQVLVVVEGAGEVVLNRRHSAVHANSLVVIPAGTRHNVINSGSIPLKLYTVYAPPQGASGVRYPTKAAALAIDA